MSALFCVCDSSGPLFVRAYGDIKTPPKVLLSLFAAVHMSSEQYHLPLETIAMDDCRVSFQQNDHYLLVLMASRLLPEHEMCAILTLLWNAIILIAGIDLLKQQPSSPLLPRLLRSNAPFFDALIKQHSSVSNGFFPLAFLSSQENNSSITRAVSSLELQVNSPLAVAYGAKIISSTSSWRHKLSPSEIFLILTYVSIIPSASLRDMPLYLPQFSPSPDELSGRTPYRILSVRVNSVEVFALCGGTPSIHEFALCVNSCFCSVDSILFSSHLCSSPCTVLLDEHILGFLYIGLSEYYVLWLRDTKNATHEKALLDYYRNISSVVSSTLYPKSYSTFRCACSSEEWNPICNSGYGATVLKENRCELYVLFDEKTHPFFATQTCGELCKRLVSELPKFGWS